MTLHLSVAQLKCLRPGREFTNSDFSYATEVG